MSSKRFKGLTEKQTEVLAQIAFNNDGGHAQGTLDALVKKGYIVARKENWGAGLTINRYDVPLSIHQEVCQWCADNLTEEDEIKFEYMQDHDIEEG